MGLFLLLLVPLAFSPSTGRAAAHRRWAKVKDRQKATAHLLIAQAAARERAVDPDGVMSPKARAQAAESLFKAQQTERSLKGVQARRAKAAGA